MNFTKRHGFASVLALILILASLFALASCDETGMGGGDGGKFGAPQNVTYDGAVITWNAVNGATGYKVSVDGGQELTITSNAYAYSKAGSEFSFVVKAVKVNSKGKETISDATTVQFKPLAKIEDVSISADGVISWGVIDSATGYEVRVDGATTEVVHVTSYDKLLEGKHSYQVRPTVSAAGDIYFYSQWSTAITANKLGTISGDKIEYVDGTLRWPTVQGAHSYEVSVNGQVS